MTDDKKTKSQLINELEKMRQKVEELEKECHVKKKTDNENRSMPDEDKWPGIVFEATNDGIWGWNTVTGEAYFSPQYYIMLGYEPGEFPANYDNWKKLLHPDDIQKTIDEIQNALNKMVPYIVEFRMKAKNGDWIWILSRGKAVDVDNDGKFIRMAGSHTDISDRKKVEEELRLTQSVVDKAPIGIWRMEKSGKIIFVNEEGAKGMGYSKDELSNMTVFDLVPGLNNDGWYNGFKILEEKGIRNLEVEQKRKCGKKITVQITEKLIRHEGRKFHVAFVYDITQRVKMEESLRLSRSIIDKANVGIYLINPGGEIQWVNRKAADLLGYNKEELETLSIEDIDNSLENQTWIPMWERLNQYEIYKFEREHRKKDGTVIPVEIYTNYLEYKGEKYAVAFVQDITERLHKDELIREKDRLLQEIGRLVKVGAWKFDINTGKATSTDEVARIFDLESLNNVKEGTALAFYHDENRERIEKAFDAAIKYGTAFDLDLEIVSAKGIHKWTRNFCNPVIKDGKVVKLIGSIQDITGIKKSQIMLKESENRYRTLIELSPLGIGIANSAGTLVDANDSFATMLGYELYEVKGLNFRDINHPEDVERELMLLKALELNKKTSYNIEKRYKHKNGNYFWVSSTVGKTYDIYGSGVFYFGMVEEIGSRKKMEQEREELINDLKKALDEIRKLQGFIPICANCKKVRDDAGYWQQVEQYIMDRTDAKFSHSLCPDCLEKLYPDIHESVL